MLSACVSQATAGKIMTGTGGVFVFVGALDVAGAFGGDCQDRGDPAITSCRSSGKPERSEGVVSLAIGAVLATAGVLLWALASDSSSPAPEPRSVHAVAPRPSPSGGYEVDQAALRFASDKPEQGHGGSDVDAGP
jgi:hypothetical protein